MCASFTLELGLSLVLIPSFNMSVSYEQIQSLSNHWARGNRTIGSIRCFVFSMTFEKDACIGSVDFDNRNVVDIANESIEEKMEVSPSSWTSIVVVVWCNTVEVVHSWFHFLEKSKCIHFRYLGNLSTSFAKFNNVVITDGEV